MAITATNITDAQKNLDQLTDDVVNFDDHVIITKPQNRNVVMVSEREYQSWQATLARLQTAQQQHDLKASDEQHQHD